jgi:hypothetical protein
MDLHAASIHRPSFENEHNSYWELANQNRLAEVDPAWLALYLMVFMFPF